MDDRNEVLHSFPSLCFLALGSKFLVSMDLCLMDGRNEELHSFPSLSLQTLGSILLVSMG